MSINARFASFRPRRNPLTQRGFGTALRRAAQGRTNALSRFRVVTAGRLARGMPATRGFRPLGLRSIGEKKLIDTGSLTISSSSSGVFTLLNGCIQGSDYTNRIGRKIICKSIYIRGYVYLETIAGTYLTQQGRMIVFIDNQPNGTVPAVTDLLVTSAPESMLNLNNRDRFKVLADETFVFDPITYGAGPVVTAGSGTTIHNVNTFRKVNLETIYNAGNAGTIADINSGALYMLWLGSIGAGGSNHDARVSCRVRFLDP